MRKKVKLQVEKARKKLEEAEEALRLAKKARRYEQLNLKMALVEAYPGMFRSNDRTPGGIAIRAEKLTLHDKRCRCEDNPVSFCVSDKLQDTSKHTQTCVYCKGTFPEFTDW